MSKSQSPFTPRDELRHQAGEETIWQESTLLHWYDRNQGIGGWHRIGHEPNNRGGRAVIWSYLFSQSGWQYRCCTDMPLLTEDEYAHGFGARERLRCLFEDNASIWLIDDGELSARLECRDFFDLVDPFPPGDELAAKRFPHHFEVAGRVTGEVAYRGQAILVDGLGYRDHSWGIRDWEQGMLNHRWFTGSFGEPLSFAAITAQAPTGKLVRVGYVVREGELVRATEIDVIAYLEPDGLTHRGGQVRMSLENGEKIHLELTAKAGVLFQRGNVVMVEMMCEVEGHGMRGYCDAEISCNARNGSGPVHLALNANCADGFSGFEMLKFPPARI
ncbi:MAG: hypothetical protein OXC05_00210 [Halieaceae bacterium]|nr:hypothetical protein [Halieaceae bacterium]